jgi:drug/metabolite transporter (DMT)-like permease
LLFHGFYLGGVFYALSKGISASLIALIVSLQPILTSILARIYLNEKLTKIQWLGVFLGFCGAFIIIISNLTESLTLLALIAGLVGLISSSLGIIWQKRIVDELPLSANNFIQAFSAFIFYIIITLCFENYYINFTDSFFISMSWQIFAVSLGAFLILMWLLKHNKANQTSTLFFLITPVSALMAYLILDEQFSYLDFFGLIVSSIGVYVVAKYQSKM